VIEDIDGIFGVQTEAAVKAFQQIFDLTPDGIIGSATWYKIKYIYNAVKGLSELVTEGLSPEEIPTEFPVAWEEGDSGIWVKLIQYYVRALGCYYPDIPIIEITGYFGPETTEAVMALQTKYDIIIDGVVGIQTWAKLDRDYRTKLNAIPIECFGVDNIYPGYILSKGMEDKNVTLIQTYLAEISKFYPNIPSVTVTGIFDDQTEAAIIAIQKNFLDLTEEDILGIIGPSSWNKIAELYENLPE